MKKLALVAALMCFGAKGFALALPASESRTEIREGSSTPWSIEGDLQAHSVSGPASPWIGIGATYRFHRFYQLGLRGYVPLSQTVDNSSYSIQSFVRMRMVQTANTELFVEPDLAMNFYQFIPFASYGVGIGVLNRYRPGLKIGVLGGLEFTNNVIDSIGLERRNSLIVYPKVAAIAEFGF